MKLFVSDGGELHISHDQRALLIVSLCFAAVVGAGDAGGAWMHFNGVLMTDDSGPLLLTALIADHLFVIGFLVASCWFVPFRKEFVFSRYTISVFDRRVFRPTTKTYLMAEVEGFRFSFYTPTRGTHDGSILAMELQSGEVVRLLKMTSVEPCQEIRTAMTKFYAEWGVEGIVGDFHEEGSERAR